MPRVSPADLLLLLVVLVGELDFSVLKWALAAMHPHVANALRFSVSAGVLGTVYGLRCRWTDTSVLAPIWANWQAVIPLGLLGFGAYQAAFVVGLNHTTAGSAALIMATNPLWTTVLAWILGTERLGRGEWTGVLGALPVLLVVGAMYEPTVAWGAVDTWAVGALLFSGGLAVGLMFVLWNQGVRRVGPSNTAVYYLVPVVALVAGSLSSTSPSSCYRSPGAGSSSGISSYCDS